MKKKSSQFQTVQIQPVTQISDTAMTLQIYGKGYKKRKRKKMYISSEVTMVNVAYIIESMLNNAKAK